jgi:monoterpene epsilon-lactone hydrolase
MSGESDEIDDTGLEKWIARVQSVLHGWVKGTPIAQMRSEWDELYFSDELPAKEDAVVIGGVPATWFTAPGARTDRVLLYLHGGGFSLGSARSHRDLAVRLSQAASCRVLVVEYRRVPEHRFPAAHDDCVAAYEALLASGVPASQLALAGDSAGGGLVVTTLLAARDRGLELAAAGVLLSAFTDLTVSRGSYESRAAVDPMDKKASIEIVARAYLKGSGADPRDPRASPIYADLHGLPPLLVQVGDREIVLDDSLDFAAAARAARVDVTLIVHQRMVHVFQQFAADVPEAAAAIATIGTFLDRHWNQAR